MTPFARSIAAGVAWVAAAAPALAQGHPHTPAMSCDTAREIVVRAGAIVLSTGPTTYDRFVDSRGYCTQTEETEPAFVPTADNPQCFIGYRCKEILNDSNR